MQFFLSVWDSTTTGWKLGALPFTLHKKKKLAKQHNHFDPFKEIARNGKDASLYVHGVHSHLDTCVCAAVNRVMNEYRSLGKHPICVHIGQSVGNVEYQSKETGLNMIDYSIAEDLNPLKIMLDLEKNFSSHYTENTIIHVTHPSHIPWHTVSEWHKTVLPLLLFKIASHPDSVCMIVSPMLSIYNAAQSTLKQQEEEHPNLTIQYLHPTPYHSIRNDQVLPNRVLFPMYFDKQDLFYNERRSNTIIDNVITAFPHVDYFMLTKSFWVYNQAIYSVGDKTGVYFMESDEVNGKKVDAKT